MRYLSFRNRIIIFCTILLILVQGIAFLLVNNYITYTAERNDSQKLETGKRVFTNVLEENIKKITDSAIVLASDFGLRSAIATRDLATIRSALQNHGARIGADIALIYGLDNQLLVDATNLDKEKTTKALTGLLEKANTIGKASGLVAIGNNAYQVTIAPVLAPDLIAWAILGFTIDDNLANLLRDLTDIHVSFFCYEKGHLKLNASTLPLELRTTLYNHLLKNINLITTESFNSDLMDGYVSRILYPGNTNPSNIITVLQISKEGSLLYIERLKKLLIWLLIGSIIVSTLGAYLIAQQVAKPLHMLADVATKINEGDYSQAANIAERDEIGLLAESFNQMRDSITVLLRLAYKDVLTSLPNRAMFNDRLSQTYKLAKRTKGTFTLMMIDLNLFKTINDTYGHDAGDLVIKTIGKRISEVLRESDTVARLGGDEFALILMTSNPQEVKIVADKIKEQIELPIDIKGHTVYVGCSIGAAIYPEHADNTVTLMKYADLSMYEAKRSNRNELVIYTPEYKLGIKSDENRKSASGQNAS